MIGNQTKSWAALALLFVNAFGLVASNDQSTVLDVAPGANQVTLGRNPKANYLSSPLKMKLASKHLKAKSTSKRSSRELTRRSSSHQEDYYRKHSSCQSKVCDETVNTIYSGVYPTVDLSFVAPSGAKQSFISFIDTGE